MFAGPEVDVFRDTNHDGVLDTVRHIGKSLESAERVPPDSPEAGPFTRAQLDEKARHWPLHWKLGELRREESKPKN